VNASRVPEMVPILSRGKHRSPSKGACFMELASFMAGERWSDHPACTHQLLASLARLVNDHTSDPGRHRLAGLIPSVIGLTSPDPKVDVVVALRSAAMALPVSAEERQRAMAVAIIVANDLLDQLGERPPDDLAERSGWALAQVPLAAQWAERFVKHSSTSVTAFRKRGAPSIVRHAVDGVAHTCAGDPDVLLYNMLVAAIDDCVTVIHPDAARAGSADPDAWAAVCRLTGATP
jgi:hypothetical protein